MELTNIQKFYEYKTIFITGGTGFVGKTLVEKLLRSCSQLQNIILPIRARKNKSVETRILEYFSDKLFDKIKNEKPEVLQKVIFVNSSLADENCGINCSDLNFVLSSVNIIFHSAATINFRAPIKEAVNINVKVTKNILSMAKEMTQLQALIYVSTVWSHCVMDYIEERVYKPMYDPELLINLADGIDETILERITSDIIDKWPNTYILTKQISEVLIDREKEKLPVSIVRVPGVTPLYREPIPGWINNLQVLGAIGIGLSTGSIKVIYCDDQYNANMLPADFVINCLIAVAWNTAIQNKNKFKVYNYSSVTNPIIRKKLFDSFLTTKYPLECAIWTPGYKTTNSEWLFQKYIFWYQTIPAYICDTFLQLFRKKPRYMKIINRNNLLLNVTACFSSGDLKLEFSNIPKLWNSLNAEDKKIFNFDADSVNWDEYLNVIHRSNKEHLLNEDFSNLHKCEAKRYL